MPPPDCVGTYEAGHHSCNGDPDGVSEESRAPCNWRNRCSGLRLYCEDRGEEPEFIVAHRTTVQLIRLCETEIAERGIIDGKPRPARSPGAPRRRRRPRRNRTCRIGKNSTQPAFRELVKEFEAALRKGLPGARFVTNGVQVLVRSGTIYRVDRSARAGYVAWYCTTSDGPRPVVRVRFLPRTEQLNAEVPASLELLRKSLSAERYRQLRARSWESGYFHARCRWLDGDSLKLCAETITRLLREGTLGFRGCFGS